MATVIVCQGAKGRRRGLNAGVCGFRRRAHRTNQLEATRSGDGNGYVVVNFYCFRPLPEDGVGKDEECALHRAHLEGSDVHGRIYICDEGINAQLSGPRNEAEEYAQWASSRFGFEWSKMPGGLSDIKDSLFDEDSGAESVNAEDWHHALTRIESGEEDAVVLDVRNDYEWEAGRFDHTQKPSTTIFRDTDDILADELENVEPDKPIYMYCTGGIRCDAYSRVLKKRGYNNLKTLEGGVQKYLVEKGRDHWKGSLYVFDDRGSIAGSTSMGGEEEMRESVRRSASEDGIPCLRCGCPVDTIPPQRNCANVDCNKIFLVCSKCAERYQGTCSDHCLSAPRLRPLIGPGETYKRWGFYMTPEQRPKPGQGKNRRRASA